MKHEQSRPNPSRQAALRAELVAMVKTEPRPRRRLSLAAATAGALAFGIAGAGAGAAFAASVTPSSDRQSVEVRLEESALAALGSATPVFGTPVVVAGVGETTVELGRMPEGATALAVGLTCLDGGRFDIEIDGVSQNWLACESRESRTLSTDELLGGFFEQHEVSRDGSHSIVVSGAPGADYAIWLAWTAPPLPPEPSVLQEAALADGVVSREEYLAGLDRYQACIEEAGWSVGIKDREAPVVDYVLDGGAVDDGSDLQCYAAEFEQLDMAWQLSLEE